MLSILVASRSSLARPPFVSRFAPLSASFLSTAAPCESSPPTSFAPLPTNDVDPQGRIAALKNTEVGIVTSTKMQKTVTIEVKRFGINKKYGKRFG